jgi:tetratricopeptide (TPR) repeat protein
MADMGQSKRSWLAAPLLWLAVPALLPAQTPAVTDPPKLAVPLHPPTQQELDHREALRLYGQALLQERENRLIDAIDALEKAARLDPESAVVRRTLVPLYLAVDRTDDALKITKQALDLDPGDYQTWYLYARQLKVQNRTRDAIVALRRAAACPGVKEHPEVRLQIAFDLATLHESAQDFTKAEAAFAEVAELLEKADVLAEDGPFNQDDLPGQRAETYERLGRVCVRAGHYDQAVAAYRKAQEADPRRRQRLAYNLADVYVGQGKLDEAVACLDEYLRTQPQGTDAYELRIKLLRRLGRDGEVLPELEGYARRDRQNAALQLLLAGQYAAAGQPAPAKGIYDTLAKESPSPEVYRGLFTLYREQYPGGPGTVLELFDDAVSHAAGPKNDGSGNPADAARARAMLAVLRDDAELVKAVLPPLRQRLEQRRPLHRETSRLFAVLAARAHRLEDAEQLYRACLPEDGPRPQPHEADIYLGLLQVLWQERKYEDVAEVCRQGLSHAQATRLAVFHYELSRALVLLDKKDEAVAEANKAVEIAGDDNRLGMRLNRARVLAEVGKTEPAVAECKALLKDHTSRDEVHDIRYTLSQVYSNAKDYARAEEVLRQVLKDSSEDATAHNDLGYIMADRGKNLEESEQLIRKALELDRKQKEDGKLGGAEGDAETAAYLDSLGWVLFKRGKLDEARKAMEKACSLPGGDDDPVVWDHMGDVYYRAKEAAKARQAWRKALDLYAAGGRRQPDERRDDIEHKLRLLDSPPGGR